MHPSRILVPLIYNLHITVNMAIKSFEIEYKGKKEQIEYEDDIPFGDMEEILRKTVNITDVTKPEIKVPEYRINLLLKVLRKAPFTIDRLTLTTMGRKTVSRVLEGVMESYPLMECLGDWMTSMLGSTLATNLSSELMLSQQNSSDGQSKKQGDAPTES